MNLETGLIPLKEKKCSTTLIFHFQANRKFKVDISFTEAQNHKHFEYSTTEDCGNEL